MKKGIMIAFMTFALLAMNNCDRNKDIIIGDRIHFTIIGTVYNNLSQGQIANAWIDIYDTLPQNAGHYTFSNSDGKYSFFFIGGYEPVQFTLFCGKDEYLTWDTLLEFPAAFGIMDTIDIYLVPE